MRLLNRQIVYIYELDHTLFMYKWKSWLLLQFIYAVLMKGRTQAALISLSIFFLSTKFMSFVSFIYYKKKNLKNHNVYSWYYSYPQNIVWFLFPITYSSFSRVKEIYSQWNSELLKMLTNHSSNEFRLIWGIKSPFSLENLTKLYITISDIISLFFFQSNFLNKISIEMCRCNLYSDEYFQLLIKNI